MSSLWDQAIKQFDPKQHRHFESRGANGKEIVLDIISTLDKEREKCEFGRSKIRGPNGKEIVLRDVYMKMANSMQTFVDAMDVAVQFDPVHTALPWAGVRLVLQLSLNSKDAFEAIIEGLEKTTNIVARCAIIESLYLSGNSEAQIVLREALVKLYVDVLEFICRARDYYKKSFISNTHGYRENMIRKLTFSIERIVADATRSRQLIDCIKTMEAKDVTVQANKSVLDSESIKGTNLLAEKANLSIELLKKDVDAVAGSQVVLQDRLRQLEAPFIRGMGQLSDLHAALQDIEKQDILEWISPINIDQQHRSTGVSLLEDSCAWLLQDATFTSWRDSSTSAFFWLYGTPGCGKTKLTYVHEIRRNATDTDHSRHAVTQHFLTMRNALQVPAPVAYFYCSRAAGEPERRSAVAILRALVKQLSIVGSSIRSPVIEPFKQRQRKAKELGTKLSELNTEECINIITELLKLCPATIIIDAVDECAPDQRWTLISALAQVIEQAKDLVKVFIASRYEKDVKSLLSHGFIRAVRPQDTKQDITSYIAYQTHNFVKDWAKIHSRSLSDYEELEKNIAAAMEKGAHGVSVIHSHNAKPLLTHDRFLWVNLQLEQMRDSNKIKLVEDLYSALRSLPANLTTSYQQLYGRIKAMEHTACTIAIRALQWLLGCQRTLSADELVTAVSGLCETSERITPDIIIDCCCNLLVFEPEAKVFRLLHPTLQEFLLQMPEFLFVEIHTAIAHRCLACLTSDSPGQDTIAGYATVYWPIHCELAHPITSKSLASCMARFFIEDDFFDVWLDGIEQELEAQTLKYNSDLLRKLEASFSTPPSPLFVMCCFGLEDALKHVANTTGLDLEQPNKHETTGLYLASRWGHTAIVGFLLTKNVYPNAPGYQFGTAIRAAAFGGYQDIVAMLLDAGAAIWGDGELPSALHSALAGGHDEVVKMLLDRGFTCVSQKQFDDTLDKANLYGSSDVVTYLLDGKGGAFVSEIEYDALHVALQGRKERRAKELIGYYPDINTTRGYHGTALHAAISGGKLSLVKLVMDFGAKLDQKGRFGYPLRAAALAGDSGIVQYLLDQGADPNIRDTKLGDPLQAAASKGHTSTMVILLDYGANVDGLGGFFRNCLQAAAYAGQGGAVRLLLDKKAEINHSGRFEDALQAAIHGGHQNVVEILIEAGARLNHWRREDDYDAYSCSAFGYPYDRESLPTIHDGSGQLHEPRELGPLEIAARHGHIGLVKVLLDKGAYIDPLDEVYYDSGRMYTALQIAAFWGHRDTVSLLLDRGADVNRALKMLGTPLQAALEGGRFGIAKLLLSRGADIDLHWRNFGSCLQVYAQRGNSEVVNFLLDHNANIEDHGGDNGTALQVASYSGDLAMVELLLERGADVNHPGGKLGGALQAASTRGHLEVIKLLLRHHADVNTVTKQRWPWNPAKSALQAAAAGGHEAVVDLLLREGACVDSTDGDPMTALTLAADSGFPGIVKALLDRGANAHLSYHLSLLHWPVIEMLQMYKRSFGNKKGNALLAACCAGHLECAKILFDRASHEYIDRGTFKGILIASILFARNEIVKLFIRTGANNCFETELFEEAFMIACQAANSEIVEAMILAFQDRADFRRGFAAALCEAAERKHASVIEALLRCGTETNAHKQGVSALQLAASPMSKSELGVLQMVDDDSKKILESIWALIKAGAPVADLGGQEEYLLPKICRQGDLEMLELLEKQGFVPSISDKCKNAALIQAATAGQLSILPNLFGLLGPVETPALYEAIEESISHGHLDTLDFLLSFKADPYAREQLSSKALVAAAKNGELGLVRHLCERETPTSSAIQEAALGVFREYRNVSPLHLPDLYDTGAERGKMSQTFAVAQYLLGRYAQTIQLEELWDVIMGNDQDIDVIRLLLNMGVDPDCKDSKGNTKLYCAAQYNKVQTIRLLIARGADINGVGGELGTALHAAASRHAPDALEALLEAGADPNIIAGTNGTALAAAMAPSFRPISCCRMLLAYGADPDIHAGYFGTALHAAAYKHNISGIRLLLEQDVDVNVYCGKYGTVLQAARAGDGYQTEQVVELLKKAGAMEKAEEAAGSRTGNEPIRSYVQA